MMRRAAGVGRYSLLSALRVILSAAANASASRRASSVFSASFRALSINASSILATASAFLDSVSREPMDVLGLSSMPTVVV